MVLAAARASAGATTRESLRLPPAVPPSGLPSAQTLAFAAALPAFRPAQACRRARDSLLAPWALRAVGFARCGRSEIIRRERRVRPTRARRRVVDPGPSPNPGSENAAAHSPPIRCTPHDTRRRHTTAANFENFLVRDAGGGGGTGEARVGGGWAEYGITKVAVRMGLQ